MIFIKLPRKPVRNIEDYKKYLTNIFKSIS